MDTKDKLKECLKEGERAERHKGLRKIEPSQEIKKTMCHPHLKVWVCDRHLFFGCSEIESK